MAERALRSWGYSKATVRTIQARYAIIRKRHGVVTPKLIVEDARDPKSPLHNFFDWDDSSAAEKYRLHQAGDLIRRVQVYVTKDGTTQPVRVYASIVKNDVRGYEEITEVMKDKVSAESFMNAMRRDLESVIRRYELYEWCQDSIALLKKAIEAIPHKE